MGRPLGRPNKTKKLRSRCVSKPKFVSSVVVNPTELQEALRLLNCETSFKQRTTLNVTDKIKMYCMIKDCKTNFRGNTYNLICVPRLIAAARTCIQNHDWKQLADVILTYFQNPDSTCINLFMMYSMIHLMYDHSIDSTIKENFCKTIYKLRSKEEIDGLLEDVCKVPGILQT